MVDLSLSAGLNKMRGISDDNAVKAMLKLLAE